MSDRRQINEELIPEETITLGDVGYNQQLRRLAATKFTEDYDLDVETEELVVAERSGYVAVWVMDGANNAEKRPE